MLCDEKSNKAATAVHHISAEKWHRSDTADHEAFYHSINERELRVSHPTHRLPLRGVEDPPLQSPPLLPARRGKPGHHFPPLVDGLEGVVLGISPGHVSGDETGGARNRQ